MHIYLETLQGTERSCVLWCFYKYFVNSGQNFFRYNSIRILLLKTWIILVCHPILFYKKYKCKKLKYFSGKSAFSDFLFLNRLVLYKCLIWFKLLIIDSSVYLQWNQESLILECLRNSSRKECRNC